MTRCLDEAKLQSYLDGELSIQAMESVTSHLASCVNCAAAARELEEESAFLTSALAAEFEANVPTDRLRQRIDAAVLSQRLAVAEAQKSGFFASLLGFGAQRTLGYASLAVVLAFAAIMGVVKLRNTTQPPAVAPGNQPANKEIAQVQPPKEAEPIPPVQIASPTKAPIPVIYHPVRVTAVKSTPKPAPVKLIPGERSYLQAIARLDSTIKANQKTMRPSLQVEYERNLAVVDRAIAATRSAAKNNPNDSDAADFMFAAYQSKVDLLNTIADARLGGGRGH
ncbi:MAG TPA: zf-HC2 domain-containing protein [Pyrinomonadaceae bacterium]|nr:zf-HC2 domain-containing protein [Pyrinomonadaceae bacterium]